MANSPMNSIGIYTTYDRVMLPHIGHSPKSLNTNLRFQNQAIQYCFFEPREAKYGKAVAVVREISCIRLRDYPLLMRCACILAQDIGELVWRSLE